MFSRREGNYWGWAMFRSAINKHNPRNDRERQQMLAQDWRLIMEELGISKDMAHTIVHAVLGKWKICSRFVPHKITDEQKVKRMETSETSFPYVTRIHCFWKTPSQPRSIASGKHHHDQDPLLHHHGRWDLVLPVRSGIKTAIDGVVFTDFPTTKKVAVLKNLRWKHCWSPPSTKKVSSMKNLFLQVKPLTPHFTRQFWTDCYSISGRFGQCCTGLENGCCSMIMPLNTVWSVCANSWLRRW